MNSWTTEPITEPGWYEVFWDADQLSATTADLVLIYYRFGDPAEGLWFTGDDLELYEAEDIWLHTKEPIKLTPKPRLEDFAVIG